MISVARHLRHQRSRRLVANVRKHIGSDRFTIIPCKYCACINLISRFSCRGSLVCSRLHNRRYNVQAIPSFRHCFLLGVGRVELPLAIKHVVVRRFFLSRTSKLHNKSTEGEFLFLQQHGQDKQCSSYRFVCFLVVLTFCSTSVVLCSSWSFPLFVSVFSGTEVVHIK